MNTLKNTLKAIGMAIVLTGTLAACSTAKVRMMPGDDGVNKVVARDIERDGAETAANKAAIEYCEKKGKEATFIQDKSQYQGKMDETTRQTVRNASTAATVLGGFHSPLSKAGRAGHMMTSDRDYESEVIFKCK